MPSERQSSFSSEGVKTIANVIRDIEKSDIANANVITEAFEGVFLQRIFYSILELELEDGTTGVALTQEILVEFCHGEYPTDEHLKDAPFHGVLFATLPEALAELAERMAEDPDSVREGIRHALGEEDGEYC